MSQLSEKLLEKAKIELGENETRRTQSIELFRDWLSKHPYIECNDLDDVNILPFLRSKKFSMPKVCDSFEKCAIFIDKFKQISFIDEKKLREFLKHLEASKIKITKIQNENQLRNVFIILKNFDKPEISGEDVLRLFYVNLSILFFELETQINRFNFIIDCREIGINFVKKLPMKIVLESSKILSSLPFRVNLMIVIGVPSFAVAISDGFFKLASSKMKERIKLVSDEIELKNYADISLLCNEFDGNESNFESVDDLKEMIKESIKKANNYALNIKIDYKKYQEIKGDETANIESFRHLEID